MWFLFRKPHSECQSSHQSLGEWRPQNSLYWNPQQPSRHGHLPWSDYPWVCNFWKTGQTFDNGSFPPVTHWLSVIQEWESLITTTLNRTAESPQCRDDQANTSRDEMELWAALLWMWNCMIPSCTSSYAFCPGEWHHHPSGKAAEVMEEWRLEPRLLCFLAPIPALLPCHATVSH